MKSTLAFIFILLFNFSAFCQWNHKGLQLYADPIVRWVGIGTQQPHADIHLCSIMPRLLLEGMPFGQGRLSLEYDGINIKSEKVFDREAKLVNEGQSYGPMPLIIENAGIVNSGSISFRTTMDGKRTNKMEINNAGQVFIGMAGANCTLPKGGIMGVNGTIYATQVIVKALKAGCFPDYVFDNNYKLRSLKEVESFIKLNKHLPEIPSAEEMEKKDVNVAEMDALLLKKIEELTLYMIELKKENESLKKDKDQLKAQVRDIYQKLEK